MLTNWGHVTFPKELSYKNNYSSEFTLLSKENRNLEWVLTNCFENGIKCENFSELRPYPDWEDSDWYCECD